MHISISSIIVGERRREDFGDLTGLAQSIRRYGLLHPIVVDDQFNLVAGERRLKAYLLLGWPEIEVKNLGELTEAERSEIEVEENDQRKDLTDLERDRRLVRRAERTAAKLAAPPEALPAADDHSLPINPTVGQTHGGQPAAADVLLVSNKLVETRSEGRPPRFSAPLSDVAAVEQTSAMTISRAARRVDAADEFPVLSKPDWKQYHVLEARAHLERLGPDERVKAASLIDQDAIPPSTGVRHASESRNDGTAAAGGNLPASG